MSLRKPAGFWRRALAHLIDTLILLAVGFGLDWILGRLNLLPETSMRFQSLSMGLYSLIALAYYIVGHSRYGTTLGKWPLHIRVIDERTGKNPRLAVSAYRCLAYLLSYLPMSAGFLMVAFHPQKKALHEAITHTRSVIR